MSKIIVKDYDPTAVVNLKDNPTYILNPKEWERSLKVTKIKYNVGDDCVFEITRGNKKWTIPLDRFFDKVIEVAGDRTDE